MATGSPWGPIRNAVGGDPDPGNPDFPEKIFSLLRTSWDLRVTPRMVRNHLIRIRTGKSGFFEHPLFRFFALLSLEPLKYGCLWNRPDPTR